MGRSVDSRPRRATWHLPVALVGCVAVIGLAAFFPVTAIPALVLALVALLWERLRTDWRIQQLAAQLVDDSLAPKVEVGEGRWAELHFALNRLLQQRRAQRRLQAMLPAWPPVAADLLVAPIPDEGLPRQVVALVVGLLPVASTADGQLDLFRRLSSVAAHQADEQQAMIRWTGDALLLVFGAFNDQSRAASLRMALRAVARIRTAIPAETLVLAMVGGAARALVVPGPGYLLVGEPLRRALNLYHQAVNRGEAALLCSEEIYLTLRHLGGPVALPTSIRSDSQPIYAITL